ncbi:MAG: HAD family hydrolase [Actinomycetota bacterium]
MSRRFDALIVDFGGVLTSPLQDAMVHFADELGIELQDLVRVALRAYAGHEDELVHGFETGHISEDEFARDFAARLEEVVGKPVDPVGLIERIFAGMTPEEDMIQAVLGARRAGYRTALLSNSWGLGLYPRERFPELFDVVVISGEVGLRKPDPDIFILTTDKLGIEASRCVFVDDHPGHLKAALEAGMTTVLHRAPGETIEELEALLEVPLGATEGQR